MSVLRAARTLIGLAGLAGLAGCATEPADRPEPPGEPGPTSSTPPNVVLLVLDTLRPDHLGFYGYPRATAPFLSRLARTGALMPEALSTTTWTAPATASLVTGLYPTRHGVTMGLHFYRLRTKQGGDGTRLRLNPLPSDVETWAETFRRHGYGTFAVTANLNIGPELAFDRGFDRFVLLRNVKADSTAATAGDDAPTHASADARAVLRQLEEWGDEIRSADPLFLYLHLDDVHRPFRIREPWYRPESNELRAAYDSEIGYADYWLARIWRAFDLHENTITIIVSDHGEAFGERGYVGHSRGLDPEVQRILFIAHGPGVRPAIHPDRASIVDALPTALELAGLPPRETAGLSLAPVLRGEDQGGSMRRQLAERPVYGHKAVFSDTFPDDWSIHRGRWKAQHSLGRWALYDTVSDPGERIDLAETHPELLAELREEAQRFAATDSVVHTDSVTVNLDAEDVEVLRSLGYAD